MNEFEWDRVSAEKEFRRAIELNPNNSNIRWTFSNFLLFQKRFDEAISQGRRDVELEPLSKRSALTVALIGSRRYDEAIAELKEVLLLDPNYAGTYIGLGIAYYGYVSGYAFAMVYLVLDKKDEALTWLEKDVDARTYFATGYAVDTLLDDVRDEPRFKAMLKRMNLPE